ncbi:MAG TPA: H4MPT-linked C1 transfer pathway protein [Methanocorpusculum sp.]|nr:H4MPT-linked C1 transfer pathway protein [Methanocorpusculum sp.]
MIGIDVGGANLKLVDDNGVHIHYCPLWKDSKLLELLSNYEDTDVAVVMSGELADGFFNKIDGINYIVNTIHKVFPHAIFYGMDGQFHDSPCKELAAANWLASVDYLRQKFPNGLMVDIGSTSTDIIPLNDFKHLIGLTDTVRLQLGYLVYTGILRTPIATLIQSVPINGVNTRVSTEYFACSGDAHYVLGNINKTVYTTATPDGKEVSYDACMRRLARTVCADIEEIGEKNTINIATTFYNAQKNIICSTINDVFTKSNLNEILVCGIGAPIFSPLIDGTDLSNIININSDALPAYSVRELAIQQNSI